MNNLISTIAAPQPKKVTYQSYTIEHGIERIDILIPLAEATKFEHSFSSATSKSKATILEIVATAGGKIQG